MSPPLPPTRSRPARIPILPCIHRSDPTGQVECQLCGSRGETWDTFDCLLHGRVTARKWKGGQPERTCELCADCRDDAGAGYAEWERATVAADVTIGITMFRRPASCERLVASIRRLYPAAKILVADNGDRPAALEGVTYLTLPFDVGLSASRNALIQALQTPYLCLCEEDFEFRDDTRLERFLSVLEHDREVGCVGGPLIAAGQREDYATALRIFRGTLEVSPAPANWRSTADGVGYRLVDQHFNWGLYRRELLVDHPWDERLKLHEHFDWFLTLRQQGRWRAAWCDVVALHHREQPEGYGEFRRRTNDFLPLLTQKWGIERVRLERGPETPAKPNLIVLGVGNCGTSILTRCLGALGWQLGDADAEFAESVGVRALNGAADFDPQAAARLLRTLPQPWALKDPRFCGTLAKWLPALAPYRPTLLWICRDLAAVAKSWERRGWNAANVAKRHAAAQAQFERWPWAKVRLDFERLLDAAELVDRDQVQGGAGKLDLDV